MNTDFAHLLGAIRTPASVYSLPVERWDALLRHARASGLLSRLALNVQDADGWGQLPEVVRRHFQAAVFIAERQARAVRWEVHKVYEALGHLGIPIVLLKGAAYVMGCLPAARGRLFGDIDILVPRAALADVEQQLGYHGWFGSHHDEYDQRYYREWMHEIPPLTHLTRGSTLDVHHNILPTSGKLKPRAERLLEHLVPIAGYPNLYRLGDADLIVHSAAHLFHEGEWDHGLRDLVDLHLLLKQFGDAPGFWLLLAERAKALDCERPLAYALRFTSRLLGGDFEVRCRHRLSVVDGVMMDPLFWHGFSACHRDLDTVWGRSLVWLLYVRSHWLRMPLRLLVPHLARKLVSNQ